LPVPSPRAGCLYNSLKSSFDHEDCADPGWFGILGPVPSAEPDQALQGIHYQQSYLSVDFVTVSFPSASGCAGWLYTSQHLSSRLWWCRASILGKLASLQLDHYMPYTMQTPEAAVLHMPFASCACLPCKLAAITCLASVT